MDGTIGAIEFKQFHYHTNRVNHAPVQSARLAVGTETDWTEDAATQVSDLPCNVRREGG